MQQATAGCVRKPQACNCLPDRDISSGTFKIWDVASLFQRAFEALAQAASSPMQAGRALEVLFDTRAARHGGAALQPHPFGVGYKRPREGWTGLPVPQW